jgi:hypothetical protein
MAPGRYGLGRWKPLPRNYVAGWGTRYERPANEAFDDDPSIVRVSDWCLHRLRAEFGRRFARTGSASTISHSGSFRREEWRSTNPIRDYRCGSGPVGARRCKSESRGCARWKNSWQKQPRSRFAGARREWPSRLIREAPDQAQERVHHRLCVVLGETAAHDGGIALVLGETAAHDGGIALRPR